jgi:hypothetical protein
VEFLHPLGSVATHVVSRWRVYKNCLTRLCILICGLRIGYGYDLDSENKRGSFRCSLLGRSLFCTMKEIIKVFFFIWLCIYFLNEAWFSNLFWDFKLYAKFPGTWRSEGQIILNYVSVVATERDGVQEISVGFIQEDLRNIVSWHALWFWSRWLSSQFWWAFMKKIGTAN